MKPGRAGSGRVRWLARGAAGFPPALVPIETELTGLWVRSRWSPAELGRCLWDRRAVAIVGARAASQAGLTLARELAWELGRAGLVVVSGLARGIDGAAHEGALLGGGLSVAVLACGLDACYPPEHATLAAEVARQGALLSEWPIGTAPRPAYFPQRNRLISGLSEVVVVVEGGPRSGARHTVRYALEMGREVMAVPRDPLLAGSRLPNELLRDGAAPVTSAAEVLAALERLPGAAGAAACAPARLGGPRAARCGTHGLQAAQQAVRRRSRRSGRSRAASKGREGAAAGLARQILAQLDAGSELAVEELTSRLPGADPGALQATLAILEIEGRLSRRRGRLRALGAG